MHKLTTLPDDAILQELMQRLHDVGIEAATVSERTIVEIDLGLAASMGVFLANESDRERAAEVLSALQVETAHKIAKCPSCRYELRGHEGRTACPECGLEFNLPCENPPTKCPHCREEVPGGFEICWNCQGEI